MATLDKIILNGVTYDIGGSGAGMTDDIKSSLDQLAQKVVYIDDDGSDYYNALHSALYPPANLSYITAVYTQSGSVYTTDSLNSLKSDLVVTAHYSNGTTATVTSYTLSGTLTVGTSVITVSYGGKTTTFNVTVTEQALYPLPDVNYDSGSPSYNTLVITGGDDISVYGLTNSRKFYVFSDGTVQSFHSTNKSTIFSIPSGATYELKVKNIYWSGNATTDNNITVGLGDSSTQNIHVIEESITVASSGQASGTTADVTRTGTISSSCDVNSFFIIVYRTMTCNFDVELRINGSRYI